MTNDRFDPSATDPNRTSGACTPDELVWFLDRAPESVRIRYFIRIAERHDGEWSIAATKLLASFDPGHIEEALKEPPSWPASIYQRRRQADGVRPPNEERPSGQCIGRSAGFAVGFALAFRFALVPLLLAARDGDFALHASAFEVEADGDQRQALAAS